MSTPYLVVGAGPTGLGCAAVLAEQGPVVVIERIPVTGGTAGWDDPTVVDVTRAARRAGVEFRLGETALRWTGQNLLLAGPGRFEHITGRHLFVAGGLRPATVANLHIDGDRPAGVVPATVAEHLLQARVRLWTTAAIIGDGPWAATVAHECRTLGTRVIGIGALDRTRPTRDHPRGRSDWADERYPEPDSMSIIGRDRVTAVRLTQTGATRVVACDAVVLAADPRPNRNIEGALLDGSADVTFIQPTSPHAPNDRYHAGRRAARTWLDTKRGDHQ